MIDADVKDVAVNSLRMNIVWHSVKPIQKRKAISVSINEKPVPSMLIDSGVITASLKFCQAIQLAFKLIASPFRAIGITGNTIKLVECPH